MRYINSLEYRQGGVAITLVGVPKDEKTEMLSEK